MNGFWDLLNQVQLVFFDSAVLQEGGGGEGAIGIFFQGIIQWNVFTKAVFCNCLYEENWSSRNTINFII